MCQQPLLSDASFARMIVFTNFSATGTVLDEQYCWSIRIGCAYKFLQILSEFFHFFFKSMQMVFETINLINAINITHTKYECTRVRESGK